VHSVESIVAKGLTRSRGGRGSVEELRYRRLEQHVRDLIWTCDLDMRLTYVSPSVCRLLGCGVDEMIGQPADAWWTPESCRRSAEALAALANGVTRPDAEMLEQQMVRKDGSAVWVEIQLTLIRDDAGRPVEILGVARDITDRLQAAERQRAAEATYRRTVERIPALIFIAGADPPFRHYYVSPQVESLVGVSVEEWSAEPYTFVKLLHPDDRDRVMRESAEARQAGRTGRLEFRLVKRDGTVGWFRSEFVFPLPEPGEPQTVQGVMLDITERKHSQQAFEESERRYRLIAENVSDVITLFSLDGRPLYVSPSVFKLRGYTVEEVMAQTLEERFSPGSREEVTRAFSEGVAALRADGQPDRTRTLEAEMCRKDGSTLWVEITASIFRDEDGHPAGILSVTRDITERKRIERMRSDFVSFTSHQLRTPLTGIKWMLELVTRLPGLPEDAREYVADAQASANRLIGLVGDLLAASRLEDGCVRLDPQPTDVGELTQVCLHDVAGAIAAAGHRISVLGAADLGVIETDPLLVRQVIANLLSNAIKFAPPADDIAIRMRRASGEIQWEIQDSGIGIPDEEQGRLFEKFYRAESGVPLSPDGTGLGLYMVRLIVERLGGRVWCESRPGAGATFHFTLPAGRSRHG
jgi:PAS domain S-box-containing protein